MIIIPDADLRSCNTFRLAATCRALIRYSTRADLEFMRREGWLGQRCLFVGGGSNLLLATPRYDGYVLINDSRRCDVSEGDGSTMKVHCSAGAVLDDVCRLTAEELGLWGLENLSGIPGTIGGAAVQNVGAYGVEFKDVVERVYVYCVDDGTESVLSVEDCCYGYRWSVFKQPENRGRYIVTAVDLRLRRDGSPRLGYGAMRSRAEQLAGEGDSTAITPAVVRRAVRSLRDEKLPSVDEVGSAGSFFKNPVVSADFYDGVVATARALWGDNAEVPCYRLDDGTVKIPAAWLIERCGWKGRSRGAAAVWSKQPLVIVNATGDATAADILGLMESIVDSVRSTFDIVLHPEVEIVR